MATTLTGKTPGNTYTWLAHFGTNDLSVLRALQTGNGTDSALSVSTNSAQIAGTLTVTGVATVANATADGHAVNRITGDGRWQKAVYLADDQLAEAALPDSWGAAIYPTWGDSTFAKNQGVMRAVAGWNGWGEGVVEVDARQAHNQVRGNLRMYYRVRASNEVYFRAGNNNNTWGVWRRLISEDAVTAITTLNGLTTTSEAVFTAGARRTSGDTNAADELMTVAQRDVRALETLAGVFESQPGLATNGAGTASTGTVQGTADVILTNAGSDNNGWRRVQLFRNVTTFSGSSGSKIECSVDIDLSGRSSFYVNQPGYGVMRVVVGDDGTSAPAWAGTNAIAAVGWGFEVRYDNVGLATQVKLFSYDGAYSESAWTTVSGLFSLEGVSWYLRKQGSTLSLWLNTSANGLIDTTATATVSHALNVPTGGQTGGQYVSQISVGDNSNTSGNPRMRTYPLIKCRVY